MYLYLKWIHIFVVLFLMGCSTTNKIVQIPPDSPMTLTQKSHLELGRRYFETNYYQKAMHELLPLACDGIPEAQYAVGYMYYYGYGVAQDVDTGYFWIKRAADKHYPPAKKALILVHAREAHPPPPIMSLNVSKSV